MGGRCFEEDSALVKRETLLIRRCVEIGGPPGQGGASASIKELTPELGHPRSRLPKGGLHIEEGH